MSSWFGYVTDFLPSLSVCKRFSKLIFGSPVWSVIVILVKVVPELSMINSSISSSASKMNSGSLSETICWSGLSDIPEVVKVLGETSVDVTVDSEVKPNDIPGAENVDGEIVEVVTTGSETRPDDVPRTMNVLGSILKTVKALKISDGETVVVDVVAVFDETETAPDVNVGKETADDDDGTTSADENVAVFDETETDPEVNVSGTVVVSSVGVINEVVKVPVKIDGIIVVSETV